MPIITLNDIIARNQLQKMVPIEESPKKQSMDFVDAIIKHEGLVPLQTPFRITSDAMRQWVSMFDDTIKTELNPDAVKPKGRENFLFLKNQEDLKPAVTEQFRRFASREPGISVIDAVNIFDQTGADGKLKFLQQQGIDINAPLEDILGQ